MKREGKVKDRKLEMRWRGDLADPKILVWHPLCQTPCWFEGGRFAAGRGRVEGGERNRKGEEGRKEEKGSGGKLEQGRQSAKAGPGRHLIVITINQMLKKC